VEKAELGFVQGGDGYQCETPKRKRLKRKPSKKEANEGVD